MVAPWKIMQACRLHDDNGRVQGKASFQPCETLYKGHRAFRHMMATCVHVQGASQVYSAVSQDRDLQIGRVPDNDWHSRMSLMLRTPQSRSIPPPLVMRDYTMPPKWIYLFDAITFANYHPLM